MSDFVDRGYNGNLNIPSMGSKHNFTQDEVGEFIKCMNDPVYFAETYFKIITADGGVEQLTLYEYQKEFISSYITNRKMVVNASRQIGKCIDFTTLINIRNKKTSEIITISVGDFFEIIKSKLNAQNKL